MDPLEKTLSNLSLEQQAHIFTFAQEIKEQAKRADNPALYYETTLLMLLSQQAIKENHWKALLKHRWFGDERPNVAEQFLERWD